MSLRSVINSVSFLAIALCCSLAQSSPAPCPGRSSEQLVRELVRKNAERAQALPTYRSLRNYRVNYRGFPGSRSAEMVVEVKFQPPATKEFSIVSQSGSKMMIDRVFKKLLEGEKEASEAENQKRTALNEENYSFKLSGCENTPQGLMYVLLVEPRVKTKFLYIGKIWVDSIDFAVSRIEAEPAKNPSFWIKQTKIEHVYGKVGEFWLPASNHSITSVRLGGRADLTIEYKDYRLFPSSPMAVGSSKD